MHDWYIKNRTRIIARSTKYNKKHRARRLRRYREVYASRYRKVKIIQMYGLTSGQFTRLDAIKFCEICGCSKQLVYDHCHKTGRVRGRICHSCNLGVGLLGDCRASLRRVLRYLTRRRVW